MRSRDPQRPPRRREREPEEPVTSGSCSALIAGGRSIADLEVYALRAGRPHAVRYPMDPDASSDVPRRAGRCVVWGRTRDTQIPDVEGSHIGVAPFPFE